MHRLVNVESNLASDKMNSFSTVQTHTHTHTLTESMETQRKVKLLCFVQIRTKIQ